MGKEEEAKKAGGYPATGGTNGVTNGVPVANSTDTQPMTSKEMYDALSIGQTVWLAKNIMTGGKTGICVGNYWGEEGTISEKDPQTEMVKVVFANDQKTGVKLFPNVLNLKPFPFKCGEWVRVVHCDRIDGWFSGRILKPGHPVLVLDMRYDSKGGNECLVRTFPYCGRAPWELTISCDNLMRMPFPTMKLAPPGELCGGFKAGDTVYAVNDIKVAPDDPDIQAGRGDAGVVFSWGQDLEHLVVCFEFRPKGNPWLSVRPSQLSRTPPLIRGRRVKLLEPMQMANGTLLNKGDLGTLMKSHLDGDGKDLLRPDFEPGDTAYAFDAPPGTIVAIVENQPNDIRQCERLALLESIAVENEKNGNALQNISLLGQNALPVLGFGTGLGLGYCAGDFTQSNLGIIIPLISGTLHSQGLPGTIFTHKAAEGMDGTLGKECDAQAFSHQALIGDKSRVGPYTEAIGRQSVGKHVLDIGTGMMCLLARLCLRAGANSVDAVEVSRRSIKSATAGFDNEAAKHCPAADDAGNLIPDWASLAVAKVEKNDGANPRLTVNLEGKKTGKAKGHKTLSLFEGYSSDTSLQLSGGYTLLVHEILGDMAGTEGAAAVVNDIRQRGLCAKDCTYIPRSASTMIAPSAKVRLSSQEMVLHRLGHAGEGELKPMSRYATRNFPLAALIADPQPLEVLDFGGDLQLHQTRDLEFRTIRDDEFDGIHLHLFAQIDQTAIIDVLALHNFIAPDGSKSMVTSSWNTTYVRLYETPVPLPKGSRIRLQCVADLKGDVASYCIKASVGEKGEEKHHVEYNFSGT